MAAVYKPVATQEEMTCGLYGQQNLACPRLAPSGLSVSCANDVRVMLLQLMHMLG